MRKMRVVQGVFLCGLLAGIFLPNLIKTSALRMTCLSDLAMLQRYLSDPVDGGDFLMYLLRSRGILWGLCGVFGISVFGVPMNLFCAVMLGFTMGGILASSILAGGVGGFLLGIVILMPQYLIYLPVGLVLYHTGFELSVKHWKNTRIGKREYRQYFFRIVMLWSGLLVGMLLESYVNPWIIRIFLGNMPFF